MRFTRSFRSTLLVALSVVLASCTSMRIVPTGSSHEVGGVGRYAKALAPGEVVRIKLRNGQAFEFTIAKVSGSELEGVKSGATEMVAINLLDVENVERKYFDALKTTLLVVAIAAGIYFVAKALLVSKLVASS